MHGLIAKDWQERTSELAARLPHVANAWEEIDRRRQLNWMLKTRTAVIVSEEQGETLLKFAQAARTAPPARFERATPGLGNRCSIH